MVAYWQKQIGRPKGRPFDALVVLLRMYKLREICWFPNGSSHGLGTKTTSRVRQMPRPKVYRQLIHFFLVNWIGLYLFNYMGNFVHHESDNNVPPAEIYFETFQLFSDLIFFGAALRCKRRNSFTVEDGRC